MATATNVDAKAVSTITWLAEPGRVIIVPVYQRQYRWDIGACEQLLKDIRSVAADADTARHFLGSILSSYEASGTSGELILIDGQQRLTTLMLLVAALAHTAENQDPDLAERLRGVVERTCDPLQTKLVPHREWARMFQDVVLGLHRADVPSVFADNYAFFRSQVLPAEVPIIWRGLQRLEHVAITLGTQANAQQIFESLNSTGEPLRDHELIHNYALMGLSHRQQDEIEQSFWIPIEENTADAIGAFWKHYLIMLSGRELNPDDEHGVYAAFRQEFADLEIAHRRRAAALWLSHAELYRSMLNPVEYADVDIARELRYLSTFGKSCYPLVLQALFAHSTGELGRADLVEVLGWIQTLYLRRRIVGLPTDRLIARLCRAFRGGKDALERAIARITPSDERIRAALKYRELPHPGYVLARVQDVSADAGFDVEHIVPVTPADSWSPDSRRAWRDLSEDEQNSYRALAGTLGNLTLLEEALSERVFGESFPAKAKAYRASAVAGTRGVGELESWRTRDISERTVSLTATLVSVWPRPGAWELDDDGITPILDAVRRRGWPAGWEREFDYVEYRGEHWEVKDVRALFNRVFRRAWTDNREEALAFSAQNGGPLYAGRSWNGPWDEFDEHTFLFMGWDSRYMITTLQGVLEATGIAAEVFVKYSYIGDVMSLR